MRTKKRVSIKRFDTKNDESSICVNKYYNYLPAETLKNSVGIAVAKFPKRADKLEEAEINVSDAGFEFIEGVEYFKQYVPDSDVVSHRLLIYGSDKKVYINQLLQNSQKIFWLYDLTFDSAPVSLAFKKDDLDAIILADGNKMVIWKTNYSPYDITDVPIITSMCMNEGVLFCSIKQPAFKIWYTKNLDASRIGSPDKYSGYITLNDNLGSAKKVVTYDQNVYIFREYGISKINIIQDKYSVSEVYTSNTLIYPNTISVCGNVIMFMTSGGLYSFNGVKVSKMDLDMSGWKIASSVNACASSLGNKYYLALKLNYDDNKQILCEQAECVNNSLIVYDLTSNSFDLVRGVDIKSLLPVKTELFEKVLCIFNSQHKEKLGEVVEVSKVFDDSLPKYWSSESLTNNHDVKMFTRLVVDAEIGVTFNLLYDNKSISFTTYKSGINEFSFKIFCKEIKLEISSNENSALVKDVYLDYYIY